MKVDVIVLVKGTPPCWKKSLDSFYRELPVNRLLIGDASCTGETLDTAKEYPNVVVYDQQKIRTIGYCIRKLIENVETEWFVFLHSDVVLPQNWFTEMAKYCGKYDWFECKKVGIYPDGTKPELKKELERQFELRRAYSGGQMGKTKVLKKVVSFIDDDFVHRTEDVVIQHILEKLGYKYGKVATTYHYHYVNPYRLTRKDRFQSMMSILKYQKTDWHSMWSNFKLFVSGK